MNANKESIPTPDLSTKVWLSEADLLKYLPLCRDTIRKARKNALLPYKKVMGKIMYKRTEVDEWIEKQHREGLKATNNIRR